MELRIKGKQVEENTPKRSIKNILERKRTARYHSSLSRTQQLTHKKKHKQKERQVYKNRLAGACTTSKHKRVERIKKTTRRNRTRKIK